VACAEIIAAAWGILSFGMRGSWLQLLWVLLSCLRQQLRRDHGLSSSTLIVIQRERVGEEQQQGRMIIF